MPVALILVHPGACGSPALRRHCGSYRPAKPLRPGGAIMWCHLQPRQGPLSRPYRVPPPTGADHRWA
eukprot:419517-Karenia_brevis.AAC.1